MRISNMCNYTIKSNATLRKLNVTRSTDIIRLEIKLKRGKIPIYL